MKDNCFYFNKKENGEEILGWFGLRYLLATAEETTETLPMILPVLVSQPQLL